MADNILTVELVTPEARLFEDQVDMVVIPGSEGDFGVLYGHAPMVSSLRAGIVETYQQEKVKERILVVGGYAEVRGKSCIILADEAVAVDQINVAKAKARLNDAEVVLRHSTNAIEISKATREKEIAEAYLFFAGSQAA